MACVKLEGKIAELERTVQAGVGETERRLQV